MYLGLTNNNVQNGLFVNKLIITTDKSISQLGLPVYVFVAVSYQRSFCLF